MKFDFCIGNPPYQGDNHQQLYPDFYLQGRKIANCVDLIFPIGWQAPKNANNLRSLNNAAIKEDKQIVFIDNKHNVFRDVTGAEWTNIIVWKKGHDNGLNGQQRLLIDGKEEKHIWLIHDNSKIAKPDEIIKLAELVKAYEDFQSISAITSARKPYGLSTDIISNTEKYGLDPLYNNKNASTDIKIYCKGDIVKYAPHNYALPRVGKAKNSYKVFVPYAWGNMSEKTGLGGAFSNIIIANPGEACSESYLESGCFSDFITAQKHAKYLMTKFVRALLYLNKYSQHSTTSWGAIPIQTYQEPWWTKSISEIDQELMKKYKIPRNIIDFVFANIQTKTEAHIVNYTMD